MVKPLRGKVARKLRKLADLIDPRVSPSDVFSIRIEVDSSDAEASVKRLVRETQALYGSPLLRLRQEFRERS